MAATVDDFGGGIDQSRRMPKVSCSRLIEVPATEMSAIVDKLAKLAARESADLGAGSRLSTKINYTATLEILEPTATGLSLVIWSATIEIPEAGQDVVLAARAAAFCDFIHVLAARSAVRERDGAAREYETDAYAGIRTGTVDA